MQNESGKPETTPDGIERMAKRLWKMNQECYPWPQSVVTWERMTELSRDAHRAQALSLLLEYQNA